ncbi:bumetanide-sensitive Na-K-Cl cotransport protein [Culex quinquefasciatus]|uniref:Bumetanide-sensitive Na-K-Cl cotransport protein n=1 Tax=Culex quinquefasciatus TaxID=7176 RepID=B0WX67_CULQU|nr:bumetanide-sensitive Na-K-Cl cotransport protein [Culex quinquefasciatus]|eukprot:XP_001861989.1 bumetanide-sensitive Na-K-Cl cotransport protein [Culex quinquefasciatus]
MAFGEELLPDLWSQNFIENETDEEASSFSMAIGILAGDITSGDLKDPSKAIPGAISVIILTSISSVGTAIVADVTVVIDATGNVSELANGSWIYADCAPEKYEYGLHNSFQVMELNRSLEEEFIIPVDILTGANISDLTDP